MFARALPLLLFARLATAAITMPLFRTESKPKEGPDRVGIGLSAVGGDSEINPKVYDGRTWLTVHVEFGVPTGNEPRRVYNLVLDTGSSDLWVVANGCQNCSWTGAGAPGGYDLSKKAGTELVPAELGYGTLTDTPANVQGVVVQDSVSLEGHKISDNFTFTVATSVAGIPIGPTLSGIFPLAPGMAGNLTKKSPIHALYEAGLIENEDVGFSANSAHPSLTIGGVDETFTSDSSGMVNVTSSNFEYYFVPLEKVLVNDVLVGASNPPVQALLDTGTTYWYGPSTVVEAIYNAIPGGKMEYDEAGNPLGILPEVPQGSTVVSLGIGGKTFNMNYSSLINTDETKRPKEPGYVFGTLMKGTNDALWILGLSFMENVYVAFNPTWSRVRIWPLAQANGGPLTEPPSGQGDQSGQLTGSVIYGYSTITAEMTNTVGGRTWTGTETRSTWVPISTTMVPVAAAPTSTPQAEASFAPELHWEPSAVVQSIVQADPTRTWTEVTTHTTWIQTPVTQTPAPAGQDQQGAASRTESTGELPVNQTPASNAQQPVETAWTTSATESAGEAHPQESEAPPLATRAPTDASPSATWTEAASSTTEEPASATETPPTEAQASEQPVRRSRNRGR